MTSDTWVRTARSDSCQGPAITAGPWPSEGHSPMVLQRHRRRLGRRADTSPASQPTPRPRREQRSVRQARGVPDREKLGHRPHLHFHAHKLFFLCRERWASLARSTNSSTPLALVGSSTRLPSCAKSGPKAEVQAAQRCSERGFTVIMKRPESWDEARIPLRFLVTADGSGLAPGVLGVRASSAPSISGH